MTQFRRRTFLIRGLEITGAVGLALPLQQRFAVASPSDAAPEMVAKGVKFLRSRQASDGSWSPDRKEPGLTAIVVTALLRTHGLAPSEPPITKALTYLEQFAGAKGGLSEAPHANYTTSIAMMAFKEANQNGRYDRLIKSSQGFLSTMQWDDGEGKGRDNSFYGGAGYGGGNSRPDLSNTAFMMEALRDSGLPADDPALQKALIFVSRCQNLKSEFNDQPWAGKVNDGGFIYTPANGGTTFAGPSDGGGLRSYASMTYAGLKSMIYAGLAPDDPRVKAAYDYITHHYSLDENPGLGERGLYYYYQTFAKTMSLLGKPTIADAGGKTHDWRAELNAALAKRQQSNGSWVNPSDRFMEGDANLVTAYALLALSYANKLS